MSHTEQDHQQDALQDAVRAWVKASLRVEVLACAPLARPEAWGSDFIAQLETVTRSIGLSRYTAQTFAEVSHGEVKSWLAAIEAEVQP